MSNFSIIDVINIIAVIAFGIWNIILTVRQNRIYSIQSRIEETTLEMQIRQSIRDASDKIREYAAQLSEDKKNTAKQKNYLSAAEDYRNAYEDACEKYVTGKVNKEWFKKMFQKEIQQLVDSESNQEYYSDSTHSAYQYTIKVYKEWFRAI